LTNLSRTILAVEKARHKKMNGVKVKRIILIFMILGFMIS